MQIEPNDAIVFETFIFDFPESIELILTKTNTDIIKIGFQAATEILLSDQQSKSSPTTF